MDAAERRSPWMPQSGGANGCRRAADACRAAARPAAGNQIARPTGAWSTLRSIRLLQPGSRAFRHPELLPTAQLGTGGATSDTVRATFFAVLFAAPSPGPAAAAGHRAGVAELGPERLRLVACAGPGLAGRHHFGGQDQPG